MDEIDTIELQAYLSQTRSPLTFPADGGAKLNLDISEDYVDAAYLMRKHMRTKLLKITVEAIAELPDTRDSVELSGDSG